MKNSYIKMILGLFFLSLIVICTGSAPSPSNSRKCFFSSRLSSGKLYRLRELPKMP